MVQNNSIRSKNSRFEVSKIFQTSSWQLLFNRTLVESLLLQYCKPITLSEYVSSHDNDHPEFDDC